MSVARKVAVLVAVAMVLGGASVARALDPEVESKTYSKGQERQTIYNTPEYQAQLRAQGAQNLADARAQQVADPERNFSLHLCTTYEDGCAGDVRLYDWGPKAYGIVHKVLFTARNGATLSGHVWATKSGPEKRPVIVFTNGSVQASETLYWFTAQILAKAGYVVLTFDPQGQGQSDEYGEGADMNEGSPAQSDGRPFFDGTEDAINFALSDAAHPYKPVPSCSTGTSHAPKQDRRAKAGLNAAYNPLWKLADSSRLGIVGHSYGAAGVSYIAQWDSRVDAVVAFDNLGATDPNAGLGEEPCPANPAARSVPRITKPGLGLAGDYGLPPTPNRSDPEPLAKSTQSLNYTKAGVDTGELIIRGGTHLDFDFIPNDGFPATLRGADMIDWYTTAWFDRYVKGDPDADARLLTNRWHNDKAEAAIDPDGDGNMFSFYYLSRLDISLARGGRFRSEDMRPGKGLAPDCEPGVYDYVSIARSPDQPRANRNCPVALTGTGRACVPRKLRATGRGIGPARLGASSGAFFKRYRAVKRAGRATRFCVVGGGSFWIGSNRGKIDLVASTARGHRTSRVGTLTKVPRAGLGGTRRLRSGLFAGRRIGPGRVVFGVRRGKVRFLAVIRSGAAKQPRALASRLSALRL